MRSSRFITITSPSKPSALVEAFVARDVERRVTEVGLTNADFDRSLRLTSESPVMTTQERAKRLT